MTNPSWKCEMTRTIKNVALVVSAVILFFFVLFVVNQTAQVVGLADRVSPAFGTAVLWFLLGLYAALVIATAVFFLRMPKPLEPPESEMEPAFSRHLDALRTRLAANPRLKGHDLSSRAGIEKALEDLGRECDVIIRDSAAAVFVSTAISQSGRLDTVFVLTAHFRMVWRIACVYSQRPALRDLINLYANVAATAFVAGELDEAEIGEQIEPILSSALGAVSLSVPGVQAAASIVVTSILTGAANAFLTLRVGIIARRWCGSLVDRRPPYAAPHGHGRGGQTPGVHRQERHGADLEGPVGRLEGQGGGSLLGAHGACPRHQGFPFCAAQVEEGRRVRSNAG